MTRLAFFAAALLAIWTAGPAHAEDVMAGSLKISAPWARATPKSASVGGAYMTITNTGAAPDRLIGASSDVASHVDVHEMSMDNGVMKMRALAKGLEIKPGQTVEFKPGGYHVMFIDLKKPFEQGQQVKATLNFEKAGKVDVSFSVQGVGAGSAGSSMPGMHGDGMGGMKMK